MKSLRVLALLVGIALTAPLASSNVFADVGCASDAECDDGDACTADICAGDVDTSCIHTAIVCYDGSECTADSCDPAQGCLFTQVGCSDQNPCTVDSCDPTAGCKFEPFDCTDNNPCTLDTCDPEIGCVDTPITCNDGDACTVDSCDVELGCVSAKIDCDDDDACTVDSCDTETGCRNTQIACDDANACTVDSCDPELGCRFTRVNCDDEDRCTIDSCNTNFGCEYREIECDDQNLCTDDICDPETGCSSTPVVCDDGNACTVESCDEELGCVSGPPIDCDDHDACTADSCDEEVGCVHTTLPSCEPPPDLDHFQCYESHRPPLNLSGVSVVDQFGESTVVVKRAKRLCAPANKNDEDPDAVNAEGHLTAYTIKQSKPHFDGEPDITVVNQFGTTALDLYRPERLLVPTSKSLTSPPGPLTEALDHFKCYRVRGARFRRKGVTVETQFGPATVDIKQPRHLCAPADKNDEAQGAETHALHLMCYQVRARPQQPRGVFTLNQFGPDEYDIFGLRELCVPSFKNPGTCGDGAINAPGELCERPGEVCASDGRKCTSDCKCPSPTCGDGIKSGTEACDPAGTPCDADGRLCNTDCTCPAPTCGDHIVDGELGEECDDGNTAGDDGCGPTCLEERCIPSQEICDGADNDCNQQIDEGNPGGGAPCLGASPGVCAAGTITCKDGVLVCEPNEPAGPEICDGKDNDCNGQTDEGNPGGGSSCLAIAAGACTAGTINCTGGSLTCTPGSPSPEVCGDATDNDCDGATDEFCCAPGEFTCGDGSCIGEEWVCDGAPDCADQSDEDEQFCQPAP